jgi:hypothetical protein
MSSIKMAAMKLGNTPRLAAWSSPFPSFPSYLIQLSPSFCGDSFLVNGVGTR